jgi:5-dehydro-4-deoxyglucarate dehydratase
VTSAPLATRLGIPGGPLFFPVTAYDPDGSVDLDTYREHVRRGVEAGAAAVFACCGTGEFHALAPEEFEDCVRAAVEETAGRVPVVAGAGYGTALAVRYARLAEDRKSVV